MKIHRLVLALLLGIAVLAPVSAEIRFESLDINDRNIALFQATVAAPVYGSYRSGFMADLASKSVRHLSFFPEQVAYLKSTQELQVQNRFGVFRSKDGLGRLEPVKGFPGFLNGGEVREGKLGPVVTSPDGRWLIYQRETSPAYGELVILDLVGNKESVISSQIELNLNDLPLRWSPDSSVFIYEKASRLYYVSMAQFSSSRMLAENLRGIGAGNIDSVRWGGYNQLYFVSGTLVYEILAAELFTRSLYQDFLKIGRIVGRLPHLFDPNFDRFWIAPDGSKILLDKGGHSLFLYLLKTDDYAKDGRALELPYLFLPRNAKVSRVLWTATDKITILTRTINAGTAGSVIYRLDAGAGKSDYTFEVLESQGIYDMIVSPDGARVALLSESGITIRTYENWRTAQTISHPEPLHLVFAEPDTMLVAGRYYAERIVLASEAVNRGFLFFCQVEELGYDKETGLPTVRSKDKIMSLDTNGWISRTPFAVSPASASSPDYRIYLENLYSGPYANLVMVRKTKELGTYALFDPPKSAFEPFPPASASDAVNFNHFEHGNRGRQRQISLTFNAVDSADGLSTILDTLSQYGIRATFFLNGEFIRRFPGAVKEIAEAGHEVGSMFYVYFNLSDARYQINDDFIMQGLARNEDDYFEATGRELSLLWRTPHYIVNDAIIEASRQLSYTLVGKDVDALDYVTKTNGIEGAQLYFPSARLVESVLDQKKPGSIVALTVGRPGHDDDPARMRDDYFFDKLDLLINNLLRRGYDIVPVSTLIEQAR